MIRSLVAMLLLGFVVMPESRPCGWCLGHCRIIVGINWEGFVREPCPMCCGCGRFESTYGELRRGYIPSEGEAQ